MTLKRRWPNDAERARTESIAQARKILAQMSPMKDALEAGKSVNSMELLVRLIRMSDSSNRIIQELMAFGPNKWKKEP